MKGFYHPRNISKPSTKGNMVLREQFVKLRSTLHAQTHSRFNHSISLLENLVTKIIPKTNLVTHRGETSEWNLSDNPVTHPNRDNASIRDIEMQSEDSLSGAPVHPKFANLLATERFNLWPAPRTESLTSFCVAASINLHNSNDGHAWGRFGREMVPIHEGIVESDFSETSSSSSENDMKKLGYETFTDHAPFTTVNEDSPSSFIAIGAGCDIANTDERKLQVQKSQILKSESHKRRDLVHLQRTDHDNLAFGYSEILFEIQDDQSLLHIAKHFCTTPGAIFSRNYSLLSTLMKAMKENDMYRSILVPGLLIKISVRDDVLSSVVQQPFRYHRHDEFNRNKKL